MEAAYEIAGASTVLESFLSCRVSRVALVVSAPVVEQCLQLPRKRPVGRWSRKRVRAGHVPKGPGPPLEALGRVAGFHEQPALAPPREVAQALVRHEPLLSLRVREAPQLGDTHARQCPPPERLGNI